MEKNNIVLLALDQASKNSGYAIFRNKKLTETHGVLSFNNTNPMKRILGLKEAIITIITEENINYVILEDILKDKEDTENGYNFKTFKTLAHVQGMIMLVCEELEIPYKIVSANEWRMACGIPIGRSADRKTCKINDINFVKNTYNIECSDDEANAICIGHSFYIDTIQKSNNGRMGWGK